MRLNVAQIRALSRLSSRHMYMQASLGDGLVRRGLAVWNDRYAKYCITVEGALALDSFDKRT